MFIRLYSQLIILSIRDSGNGALHPVTHLSLPVEFKCMSVALWFTGVYPNLNYLLSFENPSV